MNVVNKTCLVGLLSLIFWHTSGFAIPTVNSESDSEDRITVSISVNEQSINEDSQSYCKVYVNTNVAGYFSEGEELTVKVFANSEQILSVVDSITSAQENSGTINNSYNCQGAFGTATTHQIRTEVHLDDDRWLGVAENIDVSVTSEGVDEDDAENNNTLSDATLLTTNGVDYITRDPDYFEINISPPADISVILFAYLNEGPLRVALFDELSTNPIETYDLTSGFVNELELGNRTDSRYYLLVEPLNQGDYNFYKIYYNALSTGDCIADTVEEIECGNCGTQSRTCGEDGEWQLFNECTDQGVCEYGDTRTVECEDGMNEQEEICILGCVWQVTEPCPPPVSDAGTEPAQSDSGIIEAAIDSGNETVAPEPETSDAGGSSTVNENTTTDGGSTGTVNRDEQPPGQISQREAGCACQENTNTNDGRVPALLLCFFWWLSVRKTFRGRLSYFGRTFQGRWVSRHD